MFSVLAPGGNEVDAPAEGSSTRITGEPDIVGLKEVTQSLLVGSHRVVALGIFLYAPSGPFLPKRPDIELDS